MSLRPLFRFIHASNLELDRFCTASGELTHEQGRALIDAPFRATERVFEAALREQADLILLAGRVFVGQQASTWGASFLARQCERVGRRGVQVAWIDTGRERERCWPRFLPVPENLHIAHGLSAQSLQLTTDARIEVRIQSALDPAAVLQLAGPTTASQTPPFRIGVLTQPPAATATLGRPIDYWAIAGGDTAQTWAAAHGMARSAGTVQPRHSHSSAPGGCLLVDVGPGYSLGTRFVETNSIRFHVEQIAVDDSANWEGFRRRLHARTSEALEQTTADAVEFRWTVQGHGPVLERLMLPETAAGLRDELASACSTRRPMAWITAPVPEPDAVQESRWQREGSPFGALLRAMDAIPGGEGPQVDLTRLGHEPIHSVDPAAAQVPRPHYQTTLKAAARRHGAQALARAKR